jgi:diguanylate cyclase (GGDEF)-like protein
MVDLDRFKHGHPVGDEVLLEVSRRLAKRVGAKGSVYGYGGEEIAILLPNYCAEEALALAERLRKGMEEMSVGSPKLNVTASFGIACIPQHATSPEQLLRLADAALREAKDLGRNYMRISGEPRPSAPTSRQVERKQPEPGALSETQKRQLWRKYFVTSGFIRCPKDEAVLEARAVKTSGGRVAMVLISCPACGLQDRLEPDS